MAKAEVITFDEPRLAEVLCVVAEAWRERRKDFAEFVPPERHLIDILPTDTPLRTQALILFAYIRINLAGERAWTLAAQIWRMWREAPWFVDPMIELPTGMYSLFYTPKDHFTDLIHLQAMRPDLYDWWMMGLERLRLFEDADPRKIILSTDGTREGMIVVFSQFHGIAHKIAQLMIGSFHHWAIGRDPELEQFIGQNEEAHIAIDVWWMRLLRQWDVIRWWRSDHRGTVSRPSSDVVSKICTEYELDYTALCQGVWHIGSQICHHRPDENSIRTGIWCKKHCPVE